MPAKALHLLFPALLQLALAEVDPQLTGCGYDDEALPRAIPITLAVTTDATSNTTRYPFLANVMSPKMLTHACTGTLVDDDLVLAPASCVSSLSNKAEPLPIVRVGTYALDGKGGQADYEVSEWMPRPLSQPPFV
eukprot:evm.model.scf_1334.1 EVM.evm.TU.scf_1334.1   scf_1334:570-1733(-)